MWPFLSPDRKACIRANEALARVKWRAVSMPNELTRGEPDPTHGGHVRYFPSPYDVPTGIRAVQTDEAWAIAWRYLESGKAAKRVKVGDRSWAMEEKHAMRLLILEGLGYPSQSEVSHRMTTWLVNQRDDLCSHRQIMTHLKTQALTMLALARAQKA